MKKKIVKVKYTDEPIGEIEVVKDLLPKPSELVLREENIKITLSLTKGSIDFFKKEAKLHHTQYQKMIRNLLDQYARRYMLEKRDSKRKL